jgi:hypothetical protein
MQSSQGRLILSPFNLDFIANVVTDKNTLIYISSQFAHQEYKWREYAQLVDRISGKRSQRVDSIMREMTAETECPSLYWNQVYSRVREEYAKR